jgi:hypothetical protein
MLHAPPALPGRWRRRYTCSAACQRVHRACRACGAHEGPDHFHRLRDGYCYELLDADPETGLATSMRPRQSCWRVYVAGPASAA